MDYLASITDYQSTCSASRCDRCGKFTSKKYQQTQFIHDGKDCVRVVLSKTCKKKIFFPETIIMWYKLAKKKYDSAIVALWFKPASIKSLKIKHNLPKQDVTDSKEFHVTMMYIGDLVDIKKDKPVIEKALQTLADSYKDFEITLGGVATFFTEDKKRPIVLTVNSPEIEKLRNDLVSTMGAIGIVEDKDFGFVPHLTLAFTESDDLSKISLQNDTLEVSGLCLSWGGDLKHFDFGS